MNVLEYIHERGYIHADIKGANILLSSSSKSEVYLVDFGLATHFNTDKTFKPNPKKAHNGTIEYLSRDAHLGGKTFSNSSNPNLIFSYFFLVETRRGDIEILAYNLIHWLGGTLPWENNLTDPKIVQQSKEEHMSDIKKFLKTCFDNPPEPINAFLKYLNSLEHNDAPDYKKLHAILLGGLKEAGGALGKPLVFSNRKSTEKRNGTPIVEVPPKIAKKGRKPVVQPEEEKANSSTEENKDPVVKKTNGRKKIVVQNGVNGYEGYTAAMIEIAKKKQKNSKAPRQEKTEEPVASTSKNEAIVARRTLRHHPPVIYYESDGDKKAIKKRK